MKSGSLRSAASRTGLCFRGRDLDATEAPDRQLYSLVSTDGLNR